MRLSQYLYGNAGANILDGGGGGDVMVGLEGDDIYYTRDASDRALENAGQGFDRVLAGASFTLEAGSAVEFFTTIDNLATSAINLTGNGVDQYLYGNAGSNVLDGKGGADVLTGLGGADFFAFTSALGAGNADRITDFAPGSDKLRSTTRCSPALAPGALNPNAFVTGTQAQTPTTGSSTTAPPAGSSSTPTATARAPKSCSRRSTHIPPSQQATSR